jgi:hypothetical protein
MSDVYAPSPESRLAENHPLQSLPTHAAAGGRLLSLVRSLIEYDKADDPFPTQPSQNRILNAVIYGR